MCVGFLSSTSSMPCPCGFAFLGLTPTHIESLPWEPAHQALGYLLGDQSNAIVSSLAVTLVLVFDSSAVAQKDSGSGGHLPGCGDTHCGWRELLRHHSSCFTECLVADHRPGAVQHPRLRHMRSCCQPCLMHFPMTLDFSRWYAGRSLFALSIVVALALYGFRCALGKQAAFGGLIAED